jgi:uncharacterized membrane protein
MGAPAAGAPPPPYQQPYQGQPYQGQPYQGQGYAAAPAASGLQENVAGLLCYLVGWITGIVFLLIDKRPFVRFHAAQSIVVFGALTIIRIVLAFAFAGSWYFGLGILHLLIFSLLGILGLALWIILMIQAYQGKWFEIPGAAGVAKNIAGKVQ